MAQTQHYIAIDLGAESGRVMLGSVAEDGISIQEVYRFPNSPITEGGALRWDFQALIGQIKKGIAQAVRVQPLVRSIGVDTWGVDFGLLDHQGRLIENPYHYRDRRTEGMMEKAFGIIPKWELYQQTGIQFMPFNSLFQLLALKTYRPEVLARARFLLFMPDLICYHLTGQVSVEYTIASTSQMMDMADGSWAAGVLDRLGLPVDILPDVVQPGTIKGQIRPEIAAELGTGPIPIVAVGCHDTASAVAAVPATGDAQWAYLSSGTWSLMGIERTRPLISPETCELGFTNEGGVEGTIRLLTNIMGLWLVQECRRDWAEHGSPMDYGQLVEMASKARPFAAVLKVDDQRFLAPGQMPRRINEYLASTGQQTIDEPGQMVRVVLEGLALRYGQVMSSLERLSGGSIDVLHIVGGGIKNTLLNQFAADATGKTVVTGPVEATVVGNILMQAKAAGQISSLAEGRVLVARSFETKVYRPQRQDRWHQFRERAAQVLRQC
ncbi:MAG: rhamnulokinase family protein [Sedimentisphaerales bacterium]|jgi:rhamnulokinase|nr:rhamnulokinase family protein [Sedimentisphaerales bacterium]